MQLVFYTFIQLMQRVILGKLRLCQQSSQINIELYIFTVLHILYIWRTVNFWLTEPMEFPRLLKKWFIVSVLPSSFTCIFWFTPLSFQSSLLLRVFLWILYKHRLIFLCENRIRKAEIFSTAPFLLSFFSSIFP